MEDRINLLDMSYEEITSLVNSIGREKFRAGQIYSWINKGAKGIEDMTNLSKELRQSLSEVSNIAKLEICQKLISKIDNTTKYLFRLEDGNVIESVLMYYKHGLTACISSQVGCRMGCRFCASTGPGFSRNLTAGEMLDQVLTMQSDAGGRIGNVVLMGIGEPLDNYDNVIKFLRLLNHKDGLNIGYRHISISTCGLVPQMMKLLDENMPVTLSISLHAPNDKIRKEIMPVNAKYSIDKLLGACKIYTEVSKRRITFEYALISGLNDSRENAYELAGRIKGMLCHVNLIPVNKTTDLYIKSSRETIEMFRNILEKHGIEATVRRELGSDINAACGQLRRSMMETGKQ
ncbi:MAG TPA: 23S rRNA (adenine(2503)-C(2))-methyltransferase RlmN [Clostridia bacterium]